jgi:hypothetical protein
MSNPPFLPPGYQWRHVGPSHVGSRVPRKSSGRRFGFRFTGALLVLLLLGILISALAKDVLPSIVCQTACRRPPVTAGALPSPTVFQADAGWSLQYDTAGGLRVEQRSGSGIEFSAGGYPVVFKGTAASGSSPQQVAERLAAAAVPQGQFVYALPNAELGFTKGYGAVYDAFVQTTGGESQHVRYIVIAAIRGNLAISAQALGPYEPSSASDGQPNPAGTPVADAIAGPGNTVAWP